MFGELQNGLSLSKSMKMTRKQSLCMVSTYSLCIFTYFPLVNVMEELLVSMLDGIKEKRMQAYAQEKEDIEDINF